jgi:hypothetical protein
LIINNKVYFFLIMFKLFNFIIDLITFCFCISFFRYIIHLRILVFNKHLINVLILKWRCVHVCVILFKGLVSENVRILDDLACVAFFYSIFFFRHEYFVYQFRLLSLFNHFLYYLYEHLVLRRNLFNSLFELVIVLA